MRPYANYESDSGSRLIAGSTSTASAIDTFYRVVLLQLVAGNSADACAVEIGFFRLDAAKATELENIKSVR